MTLKKKIDQLKDEDAKETLETMQAQHDQATRDRAMFILGRIKQTDHIANAIFSNLSAQTIRALERFQQEKMYESLGFENFVAFLGSEYSPVPKSQYYDRLNLLEAHGDEIYDLLTSVGISVRAQKLLGRGELAIKGDRLVVGDQEIEIANTGIIKEILNELFEERRQATDAYVKEAARTKKLESQLKQGQKDFEDLRRHLDERDNAPRLERAVMKLVGAFLNLTEAVGEVDDDARMSRGREDLQLVAGLYFRLADTYGVKAPLSKNKTSDDLIDRALAEMDLEGLD